MYIICEDYVCEERARFCIEVPIDSGRGATHIHGYVCAEHLASRLRDDEWRNVRTLYIPQEGEHYYGNN